MRIEDDASSFLIVIFSSLVEILGEGTAQAFAQESGFSETNSKVHFRTDGTRLITELGGWLSRRYDSLTAKGLFIRLGRSSLTYLRRLDNEIASLGNIENRLKPVDRHFDFSLDVLGSRLQEISGFGITVEVAGKREYEWKIVKQDKCGSDQFLLPYLFFGLLEEFCVWLDSRKDYRISYQDGEEFDRSTINILIRDLI